MEITRIKLDCAIQRRNKTFRNSRHNVWPKPFGEIDVVRTPLNDAYFARLENHVLDLTGKFDESALCCNVFDGDDYSDWVGDWRENYDKLSRLSNSLKHRRTHIDTSSEAYSIYHNHFTKALLGLARLSNKMLISRHINKMARKYINGEA